jgi:hypothetical protein
MSEQPKNIMTSDPFSVVLYGAPPPDTSPRVPFVPTPLVPGNWVTCPACGTLKPPEEGCVGCLMKRAQEANALLPAPAPPVNPRDAIRAHLRAAITAALDAKLYLLANTITMALAELEKAP